MNTRLRIDMEARTVSPSNGTEGSKLNYP